jgi:hypothetical protein
LADWPSDDLVEPTGLFLIGRYRGEAQSCAGLHLRDAEIVELTGVFVRPGVRGTGGGAQLLAAADEAARSLGARRIVLDTRLDLVEARALYARHGYREIRAFSSGPYAQVWFGREVPAQARAGRHSAPNPADASVSCPISFAGVGHGTLGPVIPDRATTSGPSDSAQQGLRGSLLGSSRCGAPVSRRPRPEVVVPRRFRLRRWQAGSS